MIFFLTNYLYAKWNGRRDLMNRIKPISRLTDGPVNILVDGAMDIIVVEKQAIQSLGISRNK